MKIHPEKEFLRKNHVTNQIQLEAPPEFRESFYHSSRKIASPIRTKEVAVVETRHRFKESTPVSKIIVTENKPIQLAESSVPARAQEMSRKSKFKNFLINGDLSNGSELFQNKLYQLMGYLDRDEKGGFTKLDLVTFVGFDGPIVDDIWSYFVEDQDTPDSEVDFLMFKRGIEAMKNRQKPKRGLSRNVSISSQTNKTTPGKN